MQIFKFKLNLFNDSTLSNTSSAIVGKCTYFLVLSESFSRTAFIKRFGSSVA